MTNGNAGEFIDQLYYEDHYVRFHDEKYFLNGCQAQTDIDGNTVSVRLEVYNLTLDRTVFSVTKQSAAECVEAFEKAPVWDGKAFWNAECEMEWVDE